MNYRHTAKRWDHEEMKHYWCYFVSFFPPLAPLPKLYTLVSNVFLKSVLWVHGNYPSASLE